MCGLFCCRLADLVGLVRNGLESECCAAERDRIAFGEQLKTAVSNFAVDFVPHMEEEEEVRLKPGSRLLHIHH